MAMPSTVTSRIFHESGLRSVYASGCDAWLLILSRCCRMFAYGSSSLVVALFFTELGVPDARIGLFMTLTLLGDVVLSLFLTLVADKVGRRRTLRVGSVLMILSGVAFALSENYYVLLAAAVLGVISATGGDFGPFRAIEESIVSELTGPQTRADVLVWYVTMSSLGSSVGTEACGRFVEWLRVSRGWSLLDAYHACFWSYTAMGFVSLGITMLLSPSCELRKAVADSSLVQEPGRLSETAPLLEHSSTDTHEGGSKPGTSAALLTSATKRWSSQISRRTGSVMSVLWFLLMVDSLADGMASMSLTTYFLDQKFHLPKSSLGDIISTGYLLATCSTIFAGPLARHIGLVNTMVFTHIPSSAAVLLFPFPSSVPVTVALLLLRLGLNNMDQAPRAALIAAVVKPEERTTVMGVTGILRTLAATVGPTVTGVLAGNNRFWVAFVVAGALRLAYDVGLFAMFINIELHKHEPEPLPDELSGAESSEDLPNPSAQPPRAEISC